MDKGTYTEGHVWIGQRVQRWATQGQWNVRFQQFVAVFPSRKRRHRHGHSCVPFFVFLLLIIRLSEFLEYAA